MFKNLLSQVVFFLNDNDFTVLNCCQLISAGLGIVIAEQIFVNFLENPCDKYMIKGKILPVENERRKKTSISSVRFWTF